VARSDGGLVVNLSPVLVLALAAGLDVLGRLGPGDRSLAQVRAALLPPLVVLLTVAYGDPGHLSRWARCYRRCYVGTVDGLMPRMGPELAGLLDRAGVGPDDPVCYLDDSLLLNAMPVRPGVGRPGVWRERAWLPALPFSLFAPLPDDRARVYQARFTRRARLGGWLVEPRLPGGSSPAPGWLRQGLAQTHTPTEAVESPHWRVTRYEVNGKVRR
jgi:hypothetical protein